MPVPPLQQLPRGRGRARQERLRATVCLHTLLPAAASLSRHRAPRVEALGPLETAPRAQLRLKAPQIPPLELGVEGDQVFSIARPAGAAAKPLPSLCFRKAQSLVALFHQQSFFALPNARLLLWPLAIKPLITTLALLKKYGRYASVEQTGEWDKFNALALEIAVRAVNLIAEEEPDFGRELFEASGPGAKVFMGRQSRSGGVLFTIHTAARRLSIRNLDAPPEDSSARLEFVDAAHQAGALSGRLETMAEIGSGRLRLRGNIPLADSLDLVLRQASAYAPAP